MRLTSLTILGVLITGCAGTKPSVLRNHIEDLGRNLSALAENDPGIRSIAVTQTEGNDEDLSRWFAQELEAEFVGNESITVVDRENLEEVLAEHRLVLSDIFDEERRPRIGQLVGADALVITEIRLSPDKSYYSLRGRLVTLNEGRVVATESATLASEDLVFTEDGSVSGTRGGFFSAVGNVILAVGKMPATPVTMLLDIFETTCTNERGVGSRITLSYPERVLKGIWDGVPIPFSWISGATGNDLYLTRGMWNAWF
jgi:hypothetical protein